MCCIMISLANTVDLQGLIAVDPFFNFTPVPNRDDAVGLQVVIVGVFEHNYRQDRAYFADQFVVVFDHDVHLMFPADCQFAEKVHVTGSIQN